MSDSILGLLILAITTIGIVALSLNYKINTKIDNTKKDKETKMEVSFLKEKED